MKNPVIVISLTSIGLATIAGTVILVITGHSADSLISLLTAGASLMAASGGIFAMQAKNEKNIATVAKNVNGNTSKLLEAALNNGTLSDEHAAKISAANDELLPIAAKIAPKGPITSVTVTSGNGANGLNEN